jgi:predicted nucleic acid-binding Zn ribbon protein
MSLEDIFLRIRDDPKKRARAFKIMWLVSYSMLLLGAFLMVYFIWLSL